MSNVLVLNAWKITSIFILFMAGCTTQVTTIEKPTMDVTEPLRTQTSVSLTENRTMTPSLKAPTDEGNITPSPMVTESTIQTPMIQPSISCSSPAELTPAMTEGPYYTPGAPERTTLLEPGITGTVLTLTGYVLNEDCEPIAGALVDFWQADGQGRYDNSGFTLRGLQYTDSEGKYLLETVIPGEYPGRTPHIHVKVQAPGSEVLTTQVYFPGVNQNETDRIFDTRLLVTVIDEVDGMHAQFNFVVTDK